MIDTLEEGIMLAPHFLAKNDEDAFSFSEQLAGLPLAACMCLMALTRIINVRHEKFPATRRCESAAETSGQPAMMWPQP